MKKLLYAALCSLVLTACNNNKTAPETAQIQDNTKELIKLTKEQFSTVGIVLGKVEKKNMHGVVKASGFLEVIPQDKASVCSYIGGIIKNITVAEGTFVEQGQLLAVIENPDFIKLQEQYIAENSNLSYSEEEYKRQRELYEQNAGTGKVYQKAEADYNSEKAKVRSLELQLKMLSVNTTELIKGNFTPYINLAAPIAGYIGQISVSIGQYVEPNKSLFEISNNKKMHVDLLVYEKDLFKIRIGQKVSLLLANQSEHWENHYEPMTGEIYGINRSFENDTKAIIVHASIENEKQELIPGMYVNGDIDIDSAEVNVVPSEAIVKSDGKQWIFVVDDSNTNKENYAFRMIEVVTDVSSLGLTEITTIDTIPASSKIVIKNAFFILSKAKNAEERD